MARTHPGETAFRNLDAGTSLTFAEWERDSNRLARGLTAAGVTHGDRVSVYLPNDECLRWITAYAAVHKAGAAVVPTNTRLTVPELVTIVGHSGAGVMLTCGELLPSAQGVAAQLPSLRLASAGATGPGVMSWDKRWLDGNGAAMVVLKRLDDALRDGDTIHAVIRGFAINNDGAQKVGDSAQKAANDATK